MASSNVSTIPTPSKVTFPVLVTVIVYSTVSPKLAPTGATSLVINTVLTASILGSSGIWNGVTSLVESPSLLSPFTESISSVSTVSGSVTVEPSAAVPVSEISVISSAVFPVSPPGTSALTDAEFSTPPASTSAWRIV